MSIKFLKPSGHAQIALSHGDPVACIIKLGKESYRVRAQGCAYTTPEIPSMDFQNRYEAKRYIKAFFSQSGQ